MRRLSIGGPKFWLAYVAAVGNGMSSVPFINWCRARMGLVPVWEAAPVSFAVTMVTGLVFLTALFLGSWRIVRRKFEGDPDLPESRRLLVLVYLSSVPFVLMMVSYYLDEWSAYHLDNHDVGSLEGPFWYVNLALYAVGFAVPIYYAVRDPRHGFFFAAFSSLATISVLAGRTPEREVQLYIIGARMAIVFLYFASGIWVQRIIAGILSALLCNPLGILGARVGSIAWGIRRRRAKGRKDEAGTEAEERVVVDGGEELANEEN